MQAHQRNPISGRHPNVPYTTPFEFTTLLRDDDGPAYADQAVLFDATHVDMWFARARAERPDDLDVDFSSESIIAVAAGADCTPGQRIEIVRVDVTVGGFIGVQYGVHCRMVRGPALALAGERGAIYQPQHLIRVPKLLKRVVSFHRIHTAD